MIDNINGLNTGLTIADLDHVTDTRRIIELTLDFQFLDITAGEALGGINQSNTMAVVARIVDTFKGTRVRTEANNEVFFHNTNFLSILFSCVFCNHSNK